MNETFSLSFAPSNQLSAKTSIALDFSLGSFKSGESIGNNGHVSILSYNAGNFHGVVRGHLEGEKVI